MAHVLGEGILVLWDKETSFGVLGLGEGEPTAVQPSLSPASSAKLFVAYYAQAECLLWE